MTATVNSIVANVFPKNNAVSNSYSNAANVSLVVLLDYFNDTNGTLITAHTPDIGGAAIGFLGTEPQIQSGAMAAMAAGANLAVWDIGITSKELSAHFSVNVNAVLAGIRYINGGNLYYAHRTVGGLFRIVEVSASVTTVRATTSIAYVAGETIKVIDDGTTLTATLTSNGVDTTLSYATTLFNTVTKIAVQLTDTTTSADYISVRAL